MPSRTAFLGATLAMGPLGAQAAGPRGVVGERVLSAGRRGGSGINAAFEQKTGERVELVF
jgi:hypothetical protein